MSATDEAAGWASDFRELVGSVDTELHDISDNKIYAELFNPMEYKESQALARAMRDESSNGLLYRSVRYPECMAIALFWPDVAGIPKQGNHFSYFWDGAQVSSVKNLSTGDVFSVVE